MRPIDADAIPKEFLEYEFDGKWNGCTIKDLIDEQPTIQPEALACGNGELVAKPEPHWIPCSARMPEEHEWIGTKKFGTTISDEVYVTFENEKGERFCKHLSFQNGELSRYDKARIDAWFKGSKPIAWMPLPEPYKPNNK